MRWPALADSICIYGPTGNRKTTQVKWFSHYIADTTDKATFLVSLSGGGWVPCDPEIKAGMIIPYRVDAAITPLTVLRNISKGMWPAYPDKINAALARIADGDAGPATLDEASLTRIDWSRIGGIAIEDWTAISALVMRFLPDKGISVGGENRFQIYKNGASSAFNQVSVVDGHLVTESFGSNILPDYGYAQNFLQGMVNNMSTLPVKSVLHTAMEGKTTEEGEKGKPVAYGPSIDGKKATFHCGSWVGDLIHAQDYAIPRTVKVPDPADSTKEIEQTVIQDTVRFFFRKHPDPDTGIIFPAKPRCAPEKILELEKEYPGGYFEPEFGAEWGINRYLHTMDRLAADASKSESLQRWREKQDAALGRAR